MTTTNHLSPRGRVIAACTLMALILALTGFSVAALIAAWLASLVFAS